MSLLHQKVWISPEEYLEGELHTTIRHEYLEGEVYAMSGASENHVVIVGDIFGALRNHLRGKTCRVYSNDMKVSIRQEGKERFYYPDVVVNCDRQGQAKYFTSTPSIILEVLSASTERLDRHEKQIAYLSLPTLHTYVLVAQHAAEVTVYRRDDSGGWSLEQLSKQSDTLHLTQIGLSIPLAVIYERADFSEAFRD